MDETSQSLRNPWSDDDKSLGSIRNVLHLAQKTGHLTHRTDLSQDNPSKAREVLPKCASLQMIDTLRGITSKKKAINKTNLEIQCRMQDKDTKDLTHLNVLEKRIQKINKLNTHLQTVVSRKDELIHRLQQPYVGDYLKIEASHKQYASEVIPQLVPILSDLTSQLDNLSWASDVRILNPQMEGLLEDISALLASLQSNFHAMSQMRVSLQQVHNQRVGPQTS